MESNKREVYCFRDAKFEETTFPFELPIDPVCTKVAKHKESCRVNQHMATRRSSRISTRPA